MLPYELGFQYIWVYAWISDIPTVNMTYTISQIHTITVVGKDGIQTFEIKVDMLVLLLLMFDVFVLASAHPLLDFGQVVYQIYLNVNS